VNGRHEAQLFMATGIFARRKHVLYGIVVSCVSITLNATLTLTALGALRIASWLDGGNNKDQVGDGSGMVNVEWHVAREIY
jgi:hypothetical protein